MDNYVLPRNNYSAQIYIKSLRGLVDRYEHDQEPVHYKKAAATSVNETSCSSCLKYFNNIGLIEAEKQGVYIPSDLVIDFFTEVGEARGNAVKKIASKLTNNPVFEEILYHLGKDSVEKNELATKVANVLEMKKEDVSNIERAIDIYAELESLNVNEDGVVTLRSDSDIDPEDKDSEDKHTEPEPQKISNKPSEQNVDPEQIDPTELELPPSRGDPESLHTLCMHLRTGGKWSISDIAEETDFSNRTARGHIRYGEELGFIQRTEEGISPTERGYSLGFQTEFDDETQELFFDSILESDFYFLLLSRCIENAVEETDEGSIITTTGVEEELRTYFGFIEEKEGTLRNALNTFFQTIEATGYGEYVVGRGGRETRIKISMIDIKELKNILQAGQVGDRVEEKTSEEKKVEEEEKTESVEETEEMGESEQQGPPLRISSFRIQNFRNIQDTGVVRLENITTFIGKNESGKTSTLEAIDSFCNEDSYHQKNICNDINYGSKKDLPILTITFEITREVFERFYQNCKIDKELPIMYKITKYADGHIEENSDLGISQPTPDIIYYNNYDIISDSLYLDENGGDQNKTFKNLLEIGKLTEDVASISGLERHQAIEDAENLIESRLNEAWSQKDIRINLRYSESEDCIHLYIQDDLEEQERTLTQPSQRSEGFQWFFSFYINLLSETSTDDDGYKILLLDDPAVNLHPSGKQDWLDLLEEIAQKEQVLYTSHSPYLIEKQYPSRVRTVEDSPDGTRITADIFDADTGTLEPLRNALGINLSSSPFVSEGQVLVEGPSEYYILTAVGTYFEHVLKREFIDWNKVSIMPVRGANDAIGKASWLASEEIEYAVLLDSDEEGQSVQERISNHHQDIKDERVILLERPPHNTDVVLEDIFSPTFYVEAFNEFYTDFTANLNQDFEPLTVESDGHNSWEIGVTEYDGSRIDQVLITELKRQDVADELRNDDGKIELLKRQIAEAISDKINNNDIKQDDLKFFNRVLSKIDDSIDI